MAQLIKPQNVKVVTKEGELLISLQLDININLNQSGSFVSTAQDVSKVKAANNDDEVEWAIPEFKPSEKIKFGK